MKHEDAKSALMNDSSFRLQLYSVSLRAVRMQMRESVALIPSVGRTPSIVSVRR